MEISLAELKEKEIINIFDGKKLGRIIDILFDVENGLVRGIVVPGERKIFKKSEDIFIPLEKLRKIGDDVILVKLEINNQIMQNYGKGYRVEKERRKEKLVYNYDTTEQNQTNNYYHQERKENNFNKNINIGQSQSNDRSYVRFKPINNIKYK